MTASRFQLPAGAEYVRTTPRFDRRSVPAGLLRAHVLADGVWALLKVERGTLRFVFEDDPAHPHGVSAGESIVVPPALGHHVEPDDDATFFIEFHRAG